MKKRYNIAYLISHKTIGYPLGLQLGVTNAVEEQGHNLVNMADLLPLNDFINISHNYVQAAFELASRMDFDAYIVPIGTINAFISETGVSGSHFVDMLDPKKTIVMEDVYEGYRYVKKDNKPGMHELMKHLIEDHGYTKICFISGPETSFGARERESVYFDEMEKHGLPVEEGMFARGHFSGACDDVIEKMVYNNPDVDAIVCASDHIAETAYRVLKKHGMTPGKGIAVTGFDDIIEAAGMTPPLSTVHMSAYDIAYAAGYEAVRLCEGKPQKTDTIESYFVHRISCGEKKRDRNTNYIRLLSRTPLDKDALTRQLIDDVVETASQAVIDDCMPRFGRFVDKMAEVLTNRNRFESTSHIFGTMDLVNIFRYDNVRYISLEKFGEVISEFYDYLELSEEGSRKWWIASERSYFQRLISRSIVERYNHDTWNTQLRQHLITRITSDALLYSDNRKKALESMFDAVCRLGIKDAYLFEFPESIEFFDRSSLAMGDELRLMASMKDGKIAVSEKAEKCKIYNLVSRFMPQEVPEDTKLLRNPCYTIGALLTGREMMGVMIMGPSDIDSTEIVRIYHQMGVGVKHLELISQEKELVSALNRNNIRLSKEAECDELTGIFNRRGFMNNLEYRLNSFATGKSPEKTAAVFYMDLDGLKQINDTYGHEEGDYAIRTTADILTEVFVHGIVGRQGGDEFLGFCFLRESDEGRADWLISSIEDAMERVNASNGKPYKLQISVGFESFEVDEDTMDKLPGYLEKADEMLYRIKREHKSEQHKNHN